jgi:anti-sigma factor RsiW
MKEDRPLDEMLVSYVDGELDPADAAMIERMAGSDPRVRADLDLFRDTAILLRSACGEQHYAAAPTRALVAPLSPRWGMRLAAAVAGLVLAVGCFAVGAWWDDAWRHSFLDEAAEYHAVIARETTHLAEMSPDNAAEMVAWFSRRLGRRLAVPELGAAGLRFAGGRMLVMEGEVAADLLYTRDYGAPVAVCVVRGALGSEAMQLAEREGLRIAYWSRGGYTFLVIGDMSGSDARKLSERVAAQIEG